MTAAKGYAASTPTTDLAPWNFERREMGPNDVQINIEPDGGNKRQEYKKRKFQRQRQAFFIAAIDPLHRTVAPARQSSRRFDLCRVWRAQQSRAHHRRGGE